MAAKMSYNCKTWRPPRTSAAAGKAQVRAAPRQVMQFCATCGGMITVRDKPYGGTCSRACAQELRQRNGWTKKGQPKPMLDDEAAARARKALGPMPAPPAPA